MTKLGGCPRQARLNQGVKDKGAGIQGIYIVRSSKQLIYRFIVIGGKVDRKAVIEDLKNEIRRRTAKSGKLLDSAKKVLPNGEISSVRGFDPWPFYAQRAEGARVWDIDGNE